MPAKGKHRRPKSQRLTRSLAVAGTGGVALALPLMGVAGAHAATSHAGGHEARSYTVKPHDSLVKIAREQHVRGGWKQIYRVNRTAIGDNPSLIHPGLKLVLRGGWAHAGTSGGGTESGTSGGGTESGGSGGGKESGGSGSGTESGGAAPQDQGSAAQNSASGYTLPVAGATVGTPWHTPGSMWASGFHTGQDFIVPSGTPVHAIAAGTVVTAGSGGAYGNEVVIQHGDGRYSQYAHMSSLKVSAGQTVTGGQEIGISGATGNVTGPHLHFEIRTTPEYGSDIDPVAYLSQHGVTV